MRTSNILALTIATLTLAAASAQQPKPALARATSATVFLQGAELTQTASLTLKKGVNEVTIEGLSPDIDRNSLRINIEGGVVVSAHEYSLDYLSSTKTPSARRKMLNDSISIYREQIARIDADIKINTAMQGYLETGIAKNVSGSETGLAIDELRYAMDYYKDKSEEIHTAGRALALRRQAANSALTRLNNQRNEETGEEEKTSGVLRLNLSAPAAGTFPVTIVYYTPAASWSPYYDINAASTDRPVTITARSRVSQTTGLDWTNVRLTLSTASPSNGKVAPLFQTWFLRERSYSSNVSRALEGRVSGIAAQNSYSYPPDITVRGVVTDDQGLPLPGAMVVSPAGSAVTSATGTYTLGAVSNGDISFSFLGYMPLSVPVNGRNTINVTLEPDMQALDEVIVVGYGGSRKSQVTGAVRKEESAPEPTPTIYDFVATTDNALNVTYNIDLPYTIPTGGKEQTIDLATKEAPAEYKYYCAPRLDGASYLIAEIPNWEELELLSAPANITYDGTWIGETYIDAGSTQAKLTLTLGTDKRVAVTRELAREFNAPRTIGGNTEQTFTYRITVRNSQNRPVQMVLKDQYPTSTDRSVTVTLDSKTTTPWTANVENLGVVTWEGELKAGEVRTHTFSYTVKYPKEMRLNL